MSEVDQQQPPEPPSENQDALPGVVGAVADVAWDVVRSIWQPGVNRGLVQFMTLIFLILLLNSVLLLAFFGFNIHILILLLLTVALACLMSWFLRELASAQAQAEADAQVKASSGSSVTENSIWGKKD